MQRVSVVGNSGSGKSTFAAALATGLGVAYLELDAVFHQPGWSPLPKAQFRSGVADFMAADRWVVDGNFRAVQDLVWARADTVIWLDFSRATVMRRLVRRTLRRVATRETLWNGNRERWSNLWRLDPERSIIVWAWTQHAAYRRRYAAAMRDPANRRLSFVRLRSPGQAAAFLAGSVGVA